MQQRTYLKWFGLFLGWTLIGLFFSSQIYLITSYRKMPYSWKRSLAATLPDTYLWALLAILIIHLSRRYRFGRNSWRSALLIHFPASLLIAAFHLFVAVSIVPFFQPIEKMGWWWPTLKFSFVDVFHWNVLVYWAIVACNHALHYYRSYREKEILASQLETQLAQAQLQALRMQLQPHFLFNALHSISALIPIKPEAADRMIARLGDFLRITLKNSGTPEVTLQKELEFIDCYLEIERIRFQDRLRVKVDIDPEALDALIPNLLWQPLLENAITHGVASRTDPGNVKIEAKRVNGRLRLSIKDDGPGIQANANMLAVHPEGADLADTRARLKQMYQENFSLELRDTFPGGLEVILEIPFKKPPQESVTPPDAPHFA
jgi:two-component system, LytTR family, sensor kinase